MPHIRSAHTPPEKKAARPAGRGGILSLRCGCNALKPNYG